MDPTRQQFQVRPGALGDRLIWRFPFASAEGREALMPVLRAEQARALNAGEQPPREPQTITVGYYTQLDEPSWAWAFFPVTTPWALAALGVPVVQRRIASDLVAYIRGRHD